MNVLRLWERPPKGWSTNFKNDGLNPWTWRSITQAMELAIPEFSLIYWLKLECVHHRSHLNGSSVLIQTDFSAGCQERLAFGWWTVSDELVNFFCSSLRAGLLEGEQAHISLPPTPSDYIIWIDDADWNHFIYKSASPSLRRLNAQHHISMRM